MESGLFLRPHEIIHSSHDGLWYQVKVRIVEIQDWNLSSDSSDDDDVWPDSFDSDDDGHPGNEPRRRSNPWPKRTRFDNDVGSSSDPQLGLDWGPPFLPRNRAAAVPVVGTIQCAPEPH